MHTGGGMPWGDAFIVQTPETDKAEQQLYQSQLQRQMYAQQQNRQMDNVVNGEFAKIRSADIPDLTNAYQDYKAKQQNLLFNKSLQSNPVAYAQAQSDAQAALGKVFQISQKSGELKDQLTRLKNAYNTPNGHDLLADDFGDRFNKAMSTPVSQLENDRDLGNLNNYFYQGSNKVSLAKADQTARGKQLNYTGYNEVTPMDDKGIQSSVQRYKFGTQPSQYKQEFMNYLASNGGEREAAYQLAKIPQQELDATHQAYINSNPSDWQKKTGKAEIQDVTPKNPANKTEQLAAYMAEKYFLNNNAVPDKPQVIYNTANRMNLADQLSRARFLAEEPIKQRDRLALQNNSNKNILDRQQIAENAGETLWNTIKSKSTDGLDASLSPYKILPLDGKTSIDLATPNDAGQKMAIKEARLLKDGNVEIHQANGDVEKIPEEEAKARVIKGLLGTKAAIKTINQPQPKQSKVQKIPGF